MLYVCLRNKIDASRIAAGIFAIPKERLHGIHGNLPIVFLHSVFLSIFSSLSLPFHFTISPQSSLRPSASFHSSFFPSFCLFFSPPFPFLFFSFPYSRDKFKSALATRENLSLRFFPLIFRPAKDVATDHPSTRGRLTRPIPLIFPIHFSFDFSARPKTCPDQPSTPINLEG